jgi:hypothetical protein
MREYARLWRFAVARAIGRRLGLTSSDDCRIRLFRTATIGSSRRWTTLVWDVRGAERVCIEPSVGRVRPAGTTRLMLPAGRHRYVLTARDGAREIRQALTIVVLDEPRVRPTRAALPGLSVSHARVVARAGSALSGRPRDAVFSRRIGMVPPPRLAQVRAAVPAVAVRPPSVPTLDPIPLADATSHGIDPTAGDVDVRRALPDL